jgi:NADH dehydrogenase [ubiquinone] 1 alpha subcomplex assembly factor 7
MAEALGHPRLGYYRRALPVGAAGDFTTAPEISQMFGELIGAWLAERWFAMGSPSLVRLIELGPGRGTLMTDALRATRGLPGFHAALRLHLVDTSAPLRAEQQRALEAFAPAWYERFDQIPPGPALIVANEFFDALPVRQFHKTRHGWRERMVGLAPDGETLVLALAPGATPYGRYLPDAAAGTQAEIGEAGRALAAAIGDRLLRDGGWALIVDYGYETGAGTSLQAVRGHHGAGLLDRPGETDLSAHVDFAALAASARAPTFGPIAQRDFLCQLGILQRAESLKARATESQRAAIDAALARLIDPGQMGTLFRVLAIGDGRSTAPAGFSEAE